MYTPTPKVACSSIKLMLATAQESHRVDLIDQITNPSVSRPQTIHDPVINGLTRLVDLPQREIDNIFRSPDWVRVAALRDPVARSYSAWENRIFRRAPGDTQKAIELARDVLVDGRLDLAASFALFAQMLGEHTDAFTIDQHFLPQAHIVRTDVINYDMLIQVDKQGDMDRLSTLISERSGKTITASRLNEGMKVDLTKICDGHTANRLMATYFMDYEAFGFAPRTYAPTVEPYLLSQNETQLVYQLRGVMERLLSVSQASTKQAGARYGLRQIRRAVVRRATGGSAFRDNRILDQ
ncbi:MAG: sulfotransferase family 2 domain-containing protein [Ilumatobacteraceae bacterium]|nr:sulfotransferase family 2 domain-containing protein [Ilumatobacteraceae bacterium]